ncbi:MAG: glycosyltransferase, partial [Panacibacter sp.]
MQVLPEIISEKRTSGDFVFSIIIPSWNNLPYLKLCVESIRKNSAYKHQIIIHVNEGKDGTLEWIKQQQDIDYTFSKENVGVCYALNIARTLLS